jgi:hypothetical protein
MLKITMLLLLFCQIIAEETGYIKYDLRSGSYVAELVPNIGLNANITVKSLSDRFDVVINGGYYDSANKPSGVLKVAGVVVESNISNKLSGSLIFNKHGNIDLALMNSVKMPDWDNVLQNGPFIVDPGGGLGIRSNDGKIADRVCLAVYENGDCAIIYAKDMSLFVLATKIHRNEKKLKSVLNMDGGPMAGIWVKTASNLQNNNARPAINYIGFNIKK